MIRRVVALLIVIMAVVSLAPGRARGADLLVVDLEVRRAFFGFYGSTAFVDQPEKLWDNTVSWAVGSANPNLTHVLLFTWDGTVSDNDPANDDAIGFYNLLTTAGYQVQVDHRDHFAARTDYSGFDLAVFPNFGYADAAAPPADNIMGAGIPFITMEPGQTDELNIGTGLTVFHGTVQEGVVVDNGHVITNVYALGEVIPMAQNGAPTFKFDIPTDGIKSSGKGRVLIGEVPEPCTVLLLAGGLLIGAARLRRRGGWG